MATITKKTLLVVVAMIAAGTVTANAQVLHRRIVAFPRAHVYAPLFYDPFWPPYYPPWDYPYAVRPIGQLRVQVTPKQTEVYVDGYYAGMVADLGRLRTTPGGHAITLHLDGYRTVTEKIYVRPDATFKMKEDMVKLGPGEVTLPPPLPGPPHRG
jgi:PEGA domain-containing protein